jgi:hypothetical protein
MTLVVNESPEIDQLVERGGEFCRGLQRKGNPKAGLPADTSFIDGLYERDGASQAENS